MGEIADRYRRVAAAFDERVAQVPPGAWDRPAPCDGWVARDVVGHLVEWVPGFLSRVPSLAGATIPPVDDDPVAAWRALDAALAATLADPAVAAVELDSPAGRHTVEDAVDRFVIGDVLVHTWDLARAAGLDERLDPDEVERLLAAFLAMDADVLVASGHYGPRTPVAEGADAQTRLLAASGRRP